MDIAIIGIGYVGLVTAACLAERGHTVSCIDTDLAKIENLQQGILPIYEPGLAELIQKNHSKLHFMCSITELEHQPLVYFITVGTPRTITNSTDLTYIKQAASAIGQHLNNYAVVVVKSTTPVGTTELVNKTIKEQLPSPIGYDIVSNPEFLREGAAVHDCQNPERIIIGANSDKAITIMQNLYGKDKIIIMSQREAELSKYAANAMLATKISFINEIANICELFNIDINKICAGLGSDSRIGPAFINPGAGYGGCCLPKDINALIEMATQNGFEPSLLKAVDARNNSQKQILSEKIITSFGTDLSKSTIAIWGLAFKPGTDDMREASSIDLLDKIIAMGATIRAYDPIAHQTARKTLPPKWFEKLTLCDTAYDALAGADALALVTEWPEFSSPNYKLMKNLMKGNLIIDGRNLYDPTEMTKNGFEYLGIGVPSCQQL